MANFTMVTTQKIHLHAHVLDSQTPPQPVASANLAWAIFSGPSGGSIAVDADKMGAVFQSTAPGTFGLRWNVVGSPSIGDSSTIVVTVDTSVISGGTTTADEPEPKTPPPAG